MSQPTVINGGLDAESAQRGLLWIRREELGVILSPVTSFMALLQFTAELGARKLS